MTNEKESMSGVFSEYGEIRKPTYKEQAYKLIREAILYQKLVPDRIYSQEAICQELGVSRTPVREALLELQNEGYIVFCRGKGIQIVTLDDKSIHDILEMRLHLEITAAQLAAMRADEKDLEHIRTCLQEGFDNLKDKDKPKDFAQNYRLDHQFHRAVAQASHNELLFTTLSSVLDLYLRFEVQTVYNNESFANAIMDEHRAIYEAVAKHDQMKAAFCAQTHLQDAYRRTLSRYWN